MRHPRNLATCSRGPNARSAKDNLDAHFGVEDLARRMPHRGDVDSGLLVLRSDRERDPSVKTLEAALKAQGGADTERTERVRAELGSRLEE